VVLLLKINIEGESKGISKSKCLCFLKTRALEERGAVLLQHVRSAGEEDSPYPLTQKNTPVSIRVFFLKI